MNRRLAATMFRSTQRFLSVPKLALPVHARYLAKTIDVALIHDRMLKTGLQLQLSGRNSVIMNLHGGPNFNAQHLGQHGHVVVFSYGAVVFFDVEEKKRHECLAMLRPFCAGAIPNGFQPMEDYSIIVSLSRRLLSSSPATYGGASRPSSKTGFTPRRRRAREGSVEPLQPPGPSGAEARSAIRFDYAALRQLDIHNLAVISTVLAQSVALDHHGVKADAMLDAFTRLNSSVERTGVFSALEKKSLFRLVALNNTLFTDVIAKIGIFERSDTAWKYIEYADVWEGLREEFEIEDRFEKIEFKLNLIQQNSKFFLEVLATDKSNALEWIIIILISIEIAVMTIEIANNI